MQVIHKSWLEPLTLPGELPIRLKFVRSNTLRDALCCQFLNWLFSGGMPGIPPVILRERNDYEKRCGLERFVSLPAAVVPAGMGRVSPRCFASIRNI